MHARWVAGDKARQINFRSNHKYTDDDNTLTVIHQASMAEIPSESMWWIFST